MNHFQTSEALSCRPTYQMLTPAGVLRTLRHSGLFQNLTGSSIPCKQLKVLPVKKKKKSFHSPQSLFHVTDFGVSARGVISNHISDTFLNISKVFQTKLTIFTLLACFFFSLVLQRHPATEVRKPGVFFDIPSLCPIHHRVY